jgi:hypothetical protein
MFLSIIIISTDRQRIGDPRAGAGAGDGDGE